MDRSPREWLGVDNKTAHLLHTSSDDPQISIVRGISNIANKKHPAFIPGVLL